MPTFSDEFYKKLGHGIAEEFVNWFNQAHGAFRTDLRELNDLNYARFEAKLEQRIAELRATLREELAQMGATLRQEMANLETNLRQELAGLEAKLSQEITGLEAKLSLEVGSVESRVNNNVATLRAEVRSLKNLVRWLFGFWAASTVTILAAIIRLAGA